MKVKLRNIVRAGALLAALTAAEPSLAQKQGGILRMSHFDSPASMSILEESTVAALRPVMGVFNNLVMYKQDLPQTSMQSVIPDLATSWSSAPGRQMARRQTIHRAGRQVHLGSVDRQGE